MAQTNQQAYAVPMCENKEQLKQRPFTLLPHQWFTPHAVPHTAFRLIFLIEQGFYVEMTSREPRPLARFTQPDDPVYRDSCMEFFANFYPQLSRDYVNFEVNANGTLLCQRGSSRKDRVFVRDLGLEPPKPQATVTPDGWSVTLLIPLSFIRAVYGRSDFSPGSRILGNVYKCGDDLDQPHFGSWQHLGDQPTSFHQPEHFGWLLLTDAQPQQELA